MFIEKIKQVFPNSIIIDAALKYPITPEGWDVDMPAIEDCRFHQEDFRLVLVLQDMLTMAEDGLWPTELIKVHNNYANKVNLNQIICVVWPKGLAEDWNEHQKENNTIKVVEFSPHQYETWQHYKQSEVVLREAFAHKDYEDNFLCMNRIDKPHRRATYTALHDCPGNLSYQHLGHELKYPGFSYTEYDKHYDNLMNLLTIKKNFNTSLFSVITESQYYQRYGIITEKTFNAVVAGHPFIMIGHQGALQDIRDYGFETFPLVFNEDYDEIENNQRGVDALHSNWLMLGSTMKVRAMYEVQDFLRETIDRNRDYFFADFGPKLLDDFQKQLLGVWTG